MLRIKDILDEKNKNHPDNYSLRIRRKADALALKISCDFGK